MVAILITDIEMSRKKMFIEFSQFTFYLFFAKVYFYCQVEYDDSPLFSKHSISNLRRRLKC